MKRKNTMLPMLGGDAMVRAESLNEEERTFEIVWTTGARRRVVSWWDDDYDEELEVSTKAIRLDRMQAGNVPFLKDHAYRSVDNLIGNIVPGSARLENGQGIAAVRFSDAEEDDALWRKIKSGVLRNVSVGYRVHKYEIEKKDGEVELRRAVDWEPLEVSAVTIAADPKAQVRSEQAAPYECLLEYRQDATADQPANEERKSEMPKPNEQTAGNNGGKPDAETRSDPNPQTQTVDADTVRKEAVAAERQRLGVIDDLAKRHGFDDEVVKRWKDSDMNVDKIREAAFDEMAKRTDETSGHSQLSETARVLTDQDEKFMRGAENAIIARAGQTSLIVAAAKARGETAPKVDPGEFRGMSLVDLARWHLEHKGERSGRMPAEEVYKRALLTRGAGAGYGAQGTGDFAVLLENTMHKILLGAYQTTPDTWSRFCKIGSVTDFRPHPRYRKGSFGGLDALNEHGEFKNKTIPDGAKFSIAATTKGNIIGLSRQAFINDDMGVFSDLASDFGRAAKLTVELDVHALLSENNGMGPTMSDTNPFFHASRGNIAIDGVPSVALFSDIEKKMGEQTDIGGNEVLDIRPSILLSPLSLRGDNLVINDAQYDPDTANKLQKPNKVRGLFSDIVGTARRPGTRLYAFADPSIIPAFEVAFLDGQQEPFLDSEEGWRVDGMEWKVRLDFGVAAQDTRGAMTAKGAA